MVERTRPLIPAPDNRSEWLTFECLADQWCIHTKHFCCALIINKWPWWHHFETLSPISTTRPSGKTSQTGKVIASLHWMGWKHANEGWAKPPWLVWKSLYCCCLLQLFTVVGLKPKLTLYAMVLRQSEKYFMYLSYPSKYFSVVHKKKIFFPHI